MKKSCLFLPLLLLSMGFLELKAQTPATRILAEDVVQADEQGWTLIRMEEGASFSYQVRDCQGAAFIFLKVQNTTPQTLMARWELVIHNGSLFETLPMQEVFLAPAQEEKGGCLEGLPQLRQLRPEENPSSLQISLNLEIQAL